MNFRYLFVLLSLVSLTACPADPVCIEAIDSRASSLTLDFTKGQNCQNSAEIISIEVLRQNNSESPWYISTSDTSIYGGYGAKPFYRKPFPSSLEDWSREYDLSHEIPKGIPVSTIAYGRVPEGFFGGSATQLHAGDVIEIRVEAEVGGNSLVLTLAE